MIFERVFGVKYSKIGLKVQKFSYFLLFFSGNTTTNGMSVIEMDTISTPPKISTCRRKEGDHIYRPGDISILKASMRGQDQPSRRRVYSERGRRDNGYIQYPPYPNIFMKSNPVFASSIPFSVPQYASGLFYCFLLTFIICFFNTYSSFQVLQAVMAKHCGN